MSNFLKEALQDELNVVKNPNTRSVVERLFHARLEVRDENPELAMLLSEAREEIIGLAVDIQLLME